jgi:hypothetical protein
VASRSSPVTAGNRRFAECRYNALGKGFAECLTRQSPKGKKKKVSAKAALPNAFYRALDKAFAKCLTLDKVHSIKFKTKKSRKNSKTIFFTGEAPTGQRPPVSVEITSRGIFA